MGYEFVFSPFHIHFYNNEILEQGVHQEPLRKVYGSQFSSVTLRFDIVWAGSIYR